MLRSLLLILTVLIFARCSFISRKVYGAKKPKIETESTVLDWLKSNRLPINEVVTVDTIGFYHFFPSFAQAPLLFEKNGKFRAAGFSNGKYCPEGVDRYLSHLNPQLDGISRLDSFIVRESIIIPPDKARDLSKTKLEEIKKVMVAKKDTIRMNLYEINKLFYSLNGQRGEYINTNGYDFVLILPFAKFYGDKLQVKDLKRYYFSAAKNANAKFKIIFLNLDKQSWWGKEINDRINISI